MSRSASSRPEHALPQSPLWCGLLEQAEVGITTVRPPPERSASPTKQTAESAVARGHNRLLVALGSNASVTGDLVSELIASAVEVLQGAAGLAAAIGGSLGDRRENFADALRQRLGAHEDRVRAGEVTYCLSPDECDEAALRIRQAITARSERQDSQGDLLPLPAAAADLASLLVRAAANAAAGGRAYEAPEARTGTLDGTLHAIVAELAARARDVERPIDARGDIVAHHLAAGLRVRVSHETLQGLTSATAGEPADSALLSSARAAWLQLATCEYVAINALDDQLETPSYTERFANLPTAIIEGVANVICGARLSSRPTAFRHRKAWGHQAVALSYALEAYVAGLRGHTPSLAQAQLITVTRLVRAVAAIALLDIPRLGSPASNGSSKH